MTKLEALESALREARIYNEAGQRLTSFKNEQRDAYDFASVSKATLFDLMSAAYEAGKQAK
jgi:hypothetical protein